MSMPKTQNFSEHLERSLERLGGHVERQIESRGEQNVSEREIVKESIQSFTKEVATNQEIAAPAVQPVSHSTSQSLPSYLQEEERNESAKQIVGALIEEALSHGLEKAVTHAKKYPAFIEDAFHDALVDKLLPELKRRGILK